MTPTIRDIQNATARYYEISRRDITGPSRRSIHAHPRQVAYEVSRRITEKSFPEIGRCFGGRDHTTIISGLRSLKARDCPEESQAVMTIGNQVVARAASPVAHHAVRFMPIGEHKFLLGRKYKISEAEGGKTHD